MMVMVCFPFADEESGLEIDGRARHGHRDERKLHGAGRHEMWAPAAGSIDLLPPDQMPATLLARFDVAGKVKERRNRLVWRFAWYGFGIF